MNNVLADIINDSINGATFIALDSTTIPKLRGGKKNEMQGRVQKHTVGSNVMIFQNKNGNSSYSNMVKRRLEKEGKDPETFALSPRKWGHRIEGTPFIEHKGSHYLEVIFLHAGKTYYTLDGEIINKDSIEGLPVTYESNQGGLSDRVVIRTYNINNIDSITINRTTYKV